MALKDIFKMTKANRYTADGREELIKAQEAVTEDRRYKIGEISEKTGLQKTANGWVKPNKGGAGKAENKPAGLKPGALEEMKKEVDSPEARKNYDDFMKAYKERERKEMDGDTESKPAAEKPKTEKKHKVLIKKQKKILLMKI